jgi:hypothetical protein
MTAQHSRRAENGHVEHSECRRAAHDAALTILRRSRSFSESRTREQQAALVSDDPDTVGRRGDISSR